MKRVTTRAALREWIAATRAEGRRIGLVPTMGFLHEGHLSLLDRARTRADAAVLSIFVNPLQFAPEEDYSRYPRDLERDAQLAEARGADLLFAPDANEMYRGSEPHVFVTAPGLADRLEGRYRPGHFRGVLTVVAKLLHLVMPDVAVFGEKDYQQLVLVRRMVHDLDFSVEIPGAPIVREADGLAMSSRNVYLSPEERADARLLREALVHMRAQFRTGERHAELLLETARGILGRGRHVATQYLEIVHPETLEPAALAAPGSVALLAAHVGMTRLIDNIRLTTDEGVREEV